MNNFDLTEINQLAKDFANAYKQAIIDSGHNASGELVASIYPTVTYQNDWINITLNGKEYAKYLENGTAPHFPPISSIRKWLEVKPILAKPYKGRLVTPNQLAFLIARKISKVGTKPTNLMQNTANRMQLEEKLNQLIYKELTKTFNDENLGQYFTKTV